MTFMLLDIIRVGILIAVTLIYALYDVFNNRNIPSVFVYASVVLGLIITLTYWGQSVLGYNLVELSLLFAAIIAVFGYALYRAGLLGAGDFFEFVFISLVLPVQPQALFGNLYQFHLPFILSLFIATGYVTAWAIPIYYMAFAKSKVRKKFSVDRNRLLLGFMLLLSYLIVLMFIDIALGFKFIGMLLIALIALPSALIIVYEELINIKMVEMIRPNEMEDGDIIAVNMMSDPDRSYFSKASGHFGRLVTLKLIKDLKGEKKQLPVYKHAAPLALFTFIGVIMALAVGNIILFIIL